MVENTREVEFGATERRQMKRKKVERNTTEQRKTAGVREIQAISSEKRSQTSLSFLHFVTSM